MSLYILFFLNGKIVVNSGNREIEFFCVMIMGLGLEVKYTREGWMVFG